MALDVPTIQTISTAVAGALSPILQGRQQLNTAINVVGGQSSRSPTSLEPTERCDKMADVTLTEVIIIIIIRGYCGYCYIYIYIYIYYYACIMCYYVYNSVYYI